MRDERNEEDYTAQAEDEDIPQSRGQALAIRRYLKKLLADLGIELTGLNPATEKEPS